jgi:bifunctional DNA-binding transcriptional regulator/antitoxin component of YhaV-PrlF toxin-antitoxin module
MIMDPIPEQIRSKFGLRAGVEFVVVGSPGVVVLKTITPPDLSEFNDLIADARRQARKAGMKVSDVAKAVRETRKKR